MPISDAFEFNPPSTADTDGVTNNLVFKDAPDFESPADADMDNMYMVTVVATDSGTPKIDRHTGRGHHRHQRE